MGLLARDHERSGRPEGEADIVEFETFFRTHHRTVVRLAQNVLGEAQGAQDVAQEVFMAAHRRFHGDYEQAAGWVRVAAVHSALNLLRGERRREQRQRWLHDSASAPGPEDAVLVREARAELRRVLRRLPRRSAAALVMRHGGMSYVEIAEALGVKVGHVGTLLRRAESTLRKEMDRETHS